MSTRALLPGQLRFILIITFVYVTVWLVHYSQDPAGQYPNEAARATLDAAHALAKGISTETSGNSLYTYALSLIARFFGDAVSLPIAARGLNALALMVAAGFCASAAGHYWQRNRILWISGLLVGLNPVLVFWAGEVSPSLLATACMSVALWQILRWLRRPKNRDSIWIALSLSLAASFETSLIPLALLWPVLAFFYPKRKRILHLISALIPPAATAGLIIASSLQLQTPLQWNSDSLGLGIYQALSNQESYDGKNFSFYKQHYLILFLNPIHWGALFILAGLGAYARLKERHKGQGILLALGTLAVFSVSFAENQSGSQARASLIPLLAIFAGGGLVLIPKIWRRASKPTRRKIVFATFCLSLFSYAEYFSSTHSETWERDYIYLAEANIELGNNNQAATWAKKALELNPAHNDMQEIIVLAQFNDWAMGAKPRSLPMKSVKEFLATTQQIEETPNTRAIQAIYLYKLREIEKATALWQSQRTASPLALLCLYWTGNIRELSQNDIATHSDSLYHDILSEAWQIDRNALESSSLEKQLDAMLAFAY